MLNTMGEQYHVARHWKELLRMKGEDVELVHTASPTTYVRGVLDGVFWEKHGEEYAGVVSFDFKGGATVMVSREQLDASNEWELRWYDEMQLPLGVREYACREAANRFSCDIPPFVTEWSWSKEAGWLVKVQYHSSLEVNKVTYQVTDNESNAAGLLTIRQMVKNPHPGYEHWPAFCPNCGN